MFSDPSRGTSDEPAFLTLSQASKLAGRSYSWARDRASDGRFEVRKFASGGKIYVTTSSVKKAICAEQSRDRRCERPRRGPHLQLIIDNTK
jgi:hypothetical protein